MCGRILRLGWIVAMGLVFVRLAPARTGDLFVGFNAITATGPGSNLSRLGGGLYPSIGGDLMFSHGLGVAFQIAWRGTTRDYLGTSSRVEYDTFDFIWLPFWARKFSPELQLGAGLQELRLYVPETFCQGDRFANYACSDHFAAHLGFGLRSYLSEHVFVRPDAHVYFIRNNAEFKVPTVRRYGITIGYTFGRRPRPAVGHLRGVWKRVAKWNQ